MKGYVVYDSILGNTRRVAERIAADLQGKGHEVQLVDLSEREARGLGGDFLFIGSPNRFKRATKLVKRCAKALDKEAWKDRPIAVFNTVMRQSYDPKLTEKQKAKSIRWSYEGAAPKLRDLLLKKGLKVR